MLYLQYKVVDDLVLKTMKERRDNSWPTCVLPISLKDKLGGHLNLLSIHFHRNFLKRVMCERCV